MVQLQHQVSELTHRLIALQEEVQEQPAAQQPQRPQRPRRNRGIRMGSRTKKQTKGGQYRRTIYNNIYTHDKTLKQTPMTTDGLCFPMAFLGCQLRRWFLDENGVAVDICETKHKKNPCYFREAPTEENFLIPLCEVSTNPTGDTAFLRRHGSQFITEKTNEENGQKEGYLVLFNPYKTKASSTEQAIGREFTLEEATIKYELDAWVKVAKYVHKYVEMVMGMTIDVHDFDGCIPHYAQVFQVNIHILRVECQLLETDLFTPEQPLLNPNHEDHVYIVFGDGEGDGNRDHCHAVTHRRSMMKRVNKENECHLANYCDICHKTTDGHNILKQEGLDHYTLCRKKTHIVEGSTDFFQKTYSTDIVKENKFKKDMKTMKYTCQLCDRLTGDPKGHVCTFPLPANVPARNIPELETGGEYPNYWVYDVESASVPFAAVGKVNEETGEINLFRHRPNCICLRPVFTEEPKYHFHDAEDFCKHIISESEFQGATIFAHNGGAYDHQFVLQYLEKNVIEHDIVERPGSSHKYLDLTITGKTEKETIHMKDFLMFMCQSLKSIAKSMALPTQKGDFPHKFNNGKHDNYVGHIPPFDTVEDYYCLREKRDEDEVREMKEWLLSESCVYCTCQDNIQCDLNGYSEIHPKCGKKNWCMQKVMTAYCWDDTNILAQAIYRFREEHIAFGAEELGDGSDDWKPTSIDPLAYLTQPAAVMDFFLQGIQASTNQISPVVSEPRRRLGFSAKSIGWLEREREKLRMNQRLIHAGNSRKEYFDVVTGTFVDGFAPFDFEMRCGIVYEFYGCFWHACPHCKAVEIAENQIHPFHKVPYSIVYQKTIKKLQTLQEHYGEENVKTMWECEYDRTIGLTVTAYDHECAKLMGDRDMFYGGRTEVFSAYSKSNQRDVVEHHDVTSMYPYVCAKKLLPIGSPTFIYGRECKLERLCPTHPRAYFGYVRCHVIPRPGCMLGLLPCRDDGKLQFDLHPKIGVWFTEEIYLAMSQGYVVDEIYEIYHFEKNACSDTLFRGYMSFFLRLKQESEGWKKCGASCDNPSDEEKQRVIQKLYEENGCIGRMRADKVAKNDVKRALAKLNLNCLWGKFAQQDEGKTHHKIIVNYEQWCKDIHCNPAVVRPSIKYREMNGGIYMAYYKTHTVRDKVNPKVNVWIASAVTAHARCILHNQMIKVGPERVIYCDTDSVVFLKARDDPVQYTGRGLGKWTNETDEGDEILEFMGLAPKCYYKSEKNNASGCMKAKGVRLTISNRARATPELIRKMLAQEFSGAGDIENPIEGIQMDHMVIYSNSTNSKYNYAEVFTRYSKKIFKVVLSKRQKVMFPYTDLERQLQEGEISRLYLAPLSPYPVEENSSYSHVY